MVSHSSLRFLFGPMDRCGRFRKVCVWRRKAHKGWRGYLRSPDQGGGRAQGRARAGAGSLDPVWGPRGARGSKNQAVCLT